jgi:hypothetical protein
MPVSSTYTVYWALMLIGRRIVLIRSLLPCSCLVWSNLICFALLLCYVLFCLTPLSSVLYCTVLFCSVLFCSTLSLLVSCCVMLYWLDRIVSASYCSILYAILRNAPLWCVCYTAQCTLYSFLRLLCSEALPYCSVLVYPLTYNTIHQIYHAPWCVRIPSIFYL